MTFGVGCGSNAVTQQVSSPCVAHSESGGGARVAATPSSPVPSGVACTIAATGSGAAVTDSVSACRPNKCTADFCGLSGKGFKTCIVQDNVATCPNGFKLRGYVGGGAAANCAGCACTTPNAKCTGSIRVFDNVANCDGNGGTGGSNYKGTFGADGGCNDPNSNFDSIFYVPDPPPSPTCAPAAPTAGTGDAGLLAMKTICCAP